MNWVQLQHKLYTVARRNPPLDEVPYGFEKRVMARLRAVRPRDEWAAWARALWYSAGVCGAIALLTSIWTYGPLDGNADSSFSFAADLEQTILRSADDPDGTRW